MNIKKGNYFLLSRSSASATPKDSATATTIHICLRIVYVCAAYSK